MLGLGLLAVGLLVWIPVPAGVWHDDGVYVLLGRALALGEGLSYVGVPGSPPAPKFPPVYPAFLALLWTVLGTPGRVAVAAEALNIAFLAGASVVFVRLLGRDLGSGRLWALGTAVLAWLSVDLWQYALVPLSEALFLLLLLFTLRAGVRLERRVDLRAGVVFVALAVLLVHTRTAGVVVVGAAGLSLLSRRRWLPGAAVLGAVGLLLVPWTLWSGAAAREIALPLRDILGSYGPWLVEQVVDRPWVFVAGLPPAAVDLGERVLRILLPGLSLELRWAAGLVVLPFLACGTVLLLRRSRVVGLTLVFYLGILLIWPFQDRRLVMPVIPLFFAALALVAKAVSARAFGGAPVEEARGGPAVGGGEDAEAFPEATPEPATRPGRHVGRPWARWLARAGAAVIAVWALGFAGVSSYRLYRGYAVAGYVLRAEALRETEEVVLAHTPPDAVVGAPELWAGLGLYTGRRVAPSARFRPARVRAGDTAVGTPAEQWILWETAGLDYLVVEHGGKVHGPALDALEERCPGSVLIVATLSRGFLVRLDWDEACRASLARGSEASGGG